MTDDNFKQFQSIGKSHYSVLKGGATLSLTRKLEREKRERDKKQNKIDKKQIKAPQ